MRFDYDGSTILFVSRPEAKGPAYDMVELYPSSRVYKSLDLAPLTVTESRSAGWATRRSG